MRKTRFIENCRCYHLISRLAHQAFFLDDDEKARRGYAFMYGNGDWETCGADGSGKSPVTAAEIQVGGNYYVNATISTSSDPPRMLNVDGKTIVAGVSKD